MAQLSNKEQRWYDMSMLNIPEAVRADLAPLVKDTMQLASFPQLVIEYFFEVWNRYMARHDEQQDITCVHCRAYVVGRLRYIVDLWDKVSADEQS